MPQHTHRIIRHPRHTVRINPEYGPPSLPEHQNQQLRSITHMPTTAPREHTVLERTKTPPTGAFLRVRSSDWYSTIFLRAQFWSQPAHECQFWSITVSFFSRSANVELQFGSQLSECNFSSSSRALASQILASTHVGANFLRTRVFLNSKE